MNSPNNKVYISSLFKNFTCYLLFTFIPFSFFAQEEIDSNGYNVFYHANGKVASEGYFKNGLPDGTWKAYFPSGQLKSTGNKKDGESDSLWKFYNEAGLLTWTYTYANDLKNGCATKYDSLGNVETESYYINGIKQGEEQWFFADGSLKKQINFEDGKEEGLAVEYNEKGQIITEEEYRNGYLRNQEKFNEYDEDGKKKGTWRTYHPNGTIATEITYNAGKKDGASKEFDKDGKLINIHLMKGDSVASNPGGVVMIDLYKEYHNNGNIKLMGGLNRGLRSGIFREYDEEGNMLKAYVYINDTLVSEGMMQPGGIFDGEWTTYYEDGSVKAEGPYINGKKNGKWIYYYTDGKKEQEGYFKENVLSGQWTWYYPNGRTKRTEFYNHYGRLEGVVTEYDSLGNELARGEYYNGNREGDWFYHIGDFKEVGSFMLGQPDGVWTHFWMNGRVAFTGEYIEGEPKGKHTYYHKNGLRKLVGKYAGGVKQGVWREYDDNGEQIETIHYKHGEIIRINGFRVDPIEPDE